MYAIIYNTMDSKEIRLLSVHKTMRAAQKAWDKAFGLDTKTFVPHNYVGILCAEGLINYYGVPIKPDYEGLKVRAILEIR